MQSILNPQNHLFTLARTGKRLTRAWLASILAIAFVFFGQLFGAIPYAILLVLGLLPSASTPLGAALFLLIFFIIALTPTGLLLWGWLALYEKRSLRTLGLENVRSMPRFLRGLLLGGLLFLAVVLLLALAGLLQFQADFTGVSLAAIAAFFIALPAWILQGSLEEMVMRGWLMPVIGVRSKPWLGAVISALVFAFLHLLNPHVSVLAAINLILAGLMFALFALWEEGLWGVCALHAAWNWVQGGLGFAVSGNLLESPVLLPLQPQGPALLTGGGFGPEGGLATTLVTLSACLILGVLLYRKNKNQPKRPSDISA